MGLTVGNFVADLHRRMQLLPGFRPCKITPRPRHSPSNRQQLTLRPTLPRKCCHKFPGNPKLISPAYAIHNAFLTTRFLNSRPARIHNRLDHPASHPARILHDCSRTSFFNQLLNALSALWSPHLIFWKNQRNLSLFTCSPASTTSPFPIHPFHA